MHIHRKHSDTHRIHSDTAEFVFLGLFIFEMLLRMWALGIRIYMESSFNRFDSLVISLSAFEQVCWTQDKRMEDLINSIPNNPRSGPTSSPRPAPSASPSSGRSGFSGSSRSPCKYSAYKPSYFYWHTGLEIEPQVE